MQEADNDAPPAVPQAPADAVRAGDREDNQGVDPIMQAANVSSSVIKSGFDYTMSSVQMTCIPAQLPWDL